MTKVAEQFGVSGSYLTRVCTTLNVPRSERGYWAKLAVGKAPPPDPWLDYLSKYASIFHTKQYSNSVEV